MNRHGLTDEAIALLRKMFEAGYRRGYDHGHHEGVEGSWDPDSACFEARWSENGEQWAAQFLELVPAPLLEALNVKCWADTRWCEGAPVWDDSVRGGRWICSDCRREVSECGACGQPESRWAKAQPSLFGLGRCESCGAVEVEQRLSTMPCPVCENSGRACIRCGGKGVVLIP